LKLPALSLNPSSFLNGLNLTDRKALLLCLGIGFFIRLVPEILAFPNPIGFDTIYYGVRMQDGLVLAHWSRFFTSSWLLYSFIVPLYGVLQTDPFLILKVVAPLLFGLNVAGVYWFSRKNLGWSIHMGILAGLFFSLQLASLRISWDLLRNTLGMGILLFALSYFKEVDSKKGFILFSVFSLFSVFAHEYAAVTLVFVVLAVLVWPLLKKRVEQYSPRLAFGIVPALAVLLFGVFLRIFRFSIGGVSNIVGAGDTASGSVGGLFFLVDYLKVQNSVDSYSNYASLALNVGLLFTVLFVPYLLLVLKGFFRNSVLDSWTVLLLVGSFGCVVVPFAALQFWHRWMFMLVYPFTFYAIFGLNKLYSRVRDSKIGFSWITNRHASAMILLTFVLGIGYLSTPLLMNYVGTNVSVPSVTGTYLYFSTVPTVPYEDVEGVVDALDWLDSNMGETSSVVLQHAFVDWGQLYLDKSQEIVRFNSDVDLAVNTALEEGFESVFFVWWNQPIGWYGVLVPEYFVDVQDFGRISVYLYEVE